MTLRKIKSGKATKTGTRELEHEYETEPKEGEKSGKKILQGKADIKKK